MSGAAGEREKAQQGRVQGGQRRGRSAKVCLACTDWQKHLGEDCVPILVCDPYDRVGVGVRGLDFGSGLGLGLEGWGQAEVGAALPSV